MLKKLSMPRILNETGKEFSSLPDKDNQPAKPAFTI